MRELEREKELGKNGLVYEKRRSRDSVVVSIVYTHSLIYDDDSHSQMMFAFGPGHLEDDDEIGENKDDGLCWFRGKSETKGNFMSGDFV